MIKRFLTVLSQTIICSLQYQLLSIAPIYRMRVEILWHVDLEHALIKLQSTVASTSKCRWAACSNYNHIMALKSSCYY